MHVAWEEKFVTGLEAIDSQHMRLIAIINDLYRDIGEGRGEDAVQNIFVDLGRYADYHFETEERVMKQHGIRGKDAASHLAQHDRYLTNVMDLKLRRDAGERLVPIQVLAFVSQWWLEHIMTEDRVFATLAASPP